MPAKVRSILNRPETATVEMATAEKRWQRGDPMREECAAYGPGASPVEAVETDPETVALADTLASKRHVSMSGMRTLE